LGIQFPYCREKLSGPFFGKWRLGGAPLVITPSQVKDLLAILDDATIAVEKEIGD
jgi:hypothetical protein